MPEEPTAQFSLILMATKAILYTYALTEDGWRVPVEPIVVFDYRDRSKFLEIAKEAASRGLPTIAEKELVRDDEGNPVRDEVRLEVVRHSGLESWEELEKHSVHYMVKCYKDRYYTGVDGRNIFNGMWSSDNHLGCDLPKDEGLSAVIEMIARNIVTRREIFKVSSGEIGRQQYRRKGFTPSPIYAWIRSRQLEGTMHLDEKTGAFYQSCMRVMKGWGMVPENRCPMPARDAKWPYEVPPELDEIAKYNCCPLYARIGSLDEALLCLASALPVCASFYMNKNHWHEAAQGDIAVTADINDSAHSIFFYAWSNESECLYFQNSWGDKWGKNGHGTMSFKYFRKHLQEAYIFLPELNAPIPKVEVNAIATWLPTGRYEFLEMMDLEKGIRKAWVIIRIETDRIEIDDLFVRSEYRRQGIGKHLLAVVMDMANDLKVPVESWISIANTVPKTATLSAINALCNRFNFKITPAKVPWARMFASTTGGSAEAAELVPDETITPGCSFESLQSFISTAIEDLEDSNGEPDMV